jgi:hypothetical protein
MQKIKRFLSSSLIMGLIGLGSVLSSCAFLPMGPMMKLGDPLELDPAEVKFAIRGPEVLQLRDEDFKLTLKYEHPDLPKDLEQNFSFKNDSTTALPQGIRTDLQPGEKAEIYAFTPDSITGLRQLQQEMRARKQAGNPGKGAISISLASGCKTGPLPAGPLYVGVYAQTHKDQDFFELMPKMDLRPMMAAQGTKSEEIPNCKS